LEDNIRTDLGEIGWGGIDWIDLPRNREGSCEHGNEPSDSIKVGNFLNSWATGGFSRKAQFHGVSINILNFNLSQR
jgi:hypothetical protein